MKRWCDLNVKFLLEMNASLRGLDGIQGIIFFVDDSSQEPMACLYSPEGLKTKFPTHSLKLVFVQNLL